MNKRQRREKKQRHSRRRRKGYYWGLTIRALSDCVPARISVIESTAHGEGLTFFRKWACRSVDFAPLL